MDKKKIVVEVRNPYLDSLIKGRHDEAKSQMLTVGIVVVGGLLFLLNYILSGWHTYRQPYKFVFGFYYYVLIAPFHFIKSIYVWLGDLKITPFRNLNGIMDIIFCIGFTFLLWKLLKYIVIQVLPRTNFKPILKIFFAPAILALIWSVFISILGSIAWLFS